MSGVAQVRSPLAFSRPADVAPDPERPGLGRAVAHPMDGPASQWDVRSCPVRDLDACPDFHPTLSRQGFAHVDLSGLADLQARLAAICAAGSVTDADIAAVRRALLWAPLRLSSGGRLRIVYIAPEGFILRRAGPNGLDVTGQGDANTRTGHRPAVTVHADQDVDGTPIRQILRGAAPWLFRHQSPLHENRRSPVHLLNLWIPLQQVTRPLSLMDNATLDRPAHQVRYGLPVAAFLPRDEDRAVNDIWHFLHHPDQAWYFTADFGPERAYVFQTLSTPHAALVLPGEDAAERAWRRLDAARTALAAGDLDGLQAAVGHQPDPVPTEPLTAPLSRALDQMAQLLETARSWTALPAGDTWTDAAARAMDRVVRKSIELRAVAVVTGSG